MCGPTFQNPLYSYPFDGNKVFIRNCCQTLFERPPRRRKWKHLLKFSTFTDYMWYEYQQASMYRKHSRHGRSLQSQIVNFSPSKHFILPHCLDSATTPRPNDRDLNSRAEKMHRKEEKKRRGKGKRKEENFGDQIAKKKSLRIIFISTLVFSYVYGCMYV